MAPTPPDAHAKPPIRLRQVYKHYQKLELDQLDQHAGLLDTSTLHQAPHSHQVLPRPPELPAQLARVFSDYLQRDHDPVAPADLARAVYEVKDMPGLVVYPALLPRRVQLNLLGTLLHRDIANPQHQTNVHLFHHMLYPPVDRHGAPRSFFHPSAAGLEFKPKDPALHKPFSAQQLMDKKLRWATLGGQYDWTNKLYPSQPPPAFPADCKKLVEDLFPIKADAAILNLYSPGHTLSLHRDVSEQCDQPLVSISIGCDAIFVVGAAGEDDSASRVCALRLRSGDAVLMRGESRHAWHGVPKVLEKSCPSWLQDWPASHEHPQYEQWRGWMKTKRINFNVRQMFDRDNHCGT